jgi:hypothetical protein
MSQQQQKLKAVNVSYDPYVFYESTRKSWSISAGPKHYFTKQIHNKITKIFMVNAQSGLWQHVYVCGGYESLSGT